MSTKQANQPKTTFRFEIYQDGCDDAFDIYQDGRKRPLARIRYWTATWLAGELTKLIAKRPGLLAETKKLLAEMEAALASADWRVRYDVEQSAHLFVGVWTAIAQAERTA
jgi:hypothetical protein